MSSSRTTPQTIDRPAAPPSDMDIYQFDLNGFLVLRQALSADEVAACNGALDQMLSLDPPLAHGQWFGAVHAHTYSGTEGINLQQIYEAGEPFERLIDHPSWIEKVKHFVGGQDGFDAMHGPLFIDENFASIRGPGDAIGIHSGGADRVKRTQFRYYDGKFFCGQVNILMALTDIGPGDGGTMLIPGSHKSNFQHPQREQFFLGRGEKPGADGMVGAIEVHMKAGDALLFVDAIMHGSAMRTNEGQRRICVYRYGASWGNFRHPYYPSDELLERLTPPRRQIVLPQQPIKRQPNRKAGYPDPPHAIETRDYRGG